VAVTMMAVTVMTVPVTMAIAVTVVMAIVVGVRMRTHDPMLSGFGGGRAGRKDPPVSYLSMKTCGARQLRKVPPVALATAATIFAPMASISGSVSGLAVGWIVTAMARDFRPGSIPCP
jgi:hypothetical protein